MITTLKIENLKGITASLDFGKAVAVVGPNYSGKTAVADALRLALTGEHPELGKANAAIFKLCSGTSLYVGASFDTGLHIDRTWTLRGKSVKAEVMGDTAAALPPFLLDTQIFLKANAKERLRMVASGAGDAEAKAATRLAAELDLQASNFETMEGLAVGYEADAKDWKAVGKRFLGMLEGTTLVDAEKEAKARPDVQAAQRAAVAAFDAVKQARQKVKDLGDRQRAGEEAMGKLKNIPEDVDTLIAKIADLEEKRDQVEKVGAAARERASALASTVATLSMQCSGITDRFPRASEPTEQLAAEIDRLEALEELTDADANAAAQAAIDARDAMTRATSAAASAKGAKQQAEKRLAEFETLTCCPTCLAASPGWKDAVKAGLNKAAADAHAHELATDATMKAAEKAADEATAERKRVGDIVYQRSILSTLQTILTAAIQWSDLVRRKTEAAALHDPLAEQAVNAAAHLVEIRNQLGVARLALQTAQGAEHLRAVVADMPTEEDHDHADRAVMAAEDALEVANAAQVAAQTADREHAAAEEREANIREARVKADDAEAKAADAAAKAKTIRQIMQEEMASAFNMVAAAAEQFSTAVLGSKLVVEDGIMGRWIGAAFVPFDVLSGAEQVVATIALQVGLQGGKGALVMIDEVSRVDVKRKVELAKVLVDSISDGTIDQAFVFDHDAAFWGTTGFQSITPADLPK